LFREEVKPQLGQHRIVKQVQQQQVRFGMWRLL
jgi:hypothetical protein